MNSSASMVMQKINERQSIKNNLELKYQNFSLLISEINLLIHRKKSYTALKLTEIESKININSITKKNK